jgi:hypothetical protein
VDITRLLGRSGVEEFRNNEIDKMWMSVGHEVIETIRKLLER